MTAVTKQNADLYIGQALVLEFTIYEDDALTTPKNLGTVSALEWRLGDEAAGTLTLKITETPNANTSVITVTDSVNGIIEVYINAADTAALTKSNLDHNLWATEAGDPAPVADGRLTVRNVVPSA